jgi:hypothetical protein
MWSKSKKPDRRPEPAPRRRFEPRARERTDDANAFVPDPEGGPARAPDDLAESLGEEFVEAATSGEDRDEERLDATVPEEIGGPFVETTAGEEMGAAADDSNPPEAEREPLPRPGAGLVTDPESDEETTPTEPMLDLDALNAKGRGRTPT